MDDMMIRRATAADIPQIDELLRQVLEVHHAGRPNLFKGGVKKYTDEELKAILANDQTPVFVAVAPSANDGTDVEHNADSPATDQVLGYAFCVFQQHLNSNILTDIKTLYIDDDQHGKVTLKKHFINVDNSEARTTYPRSACQSETSSHTVRCTRTQRRVRQQKEGPMNISTFTHNSHPAIRHTHFV